MRNFKRILSLFLTVSISGISIGTRAESSVDFKTELSELKRLIDECSKKGISTDYENITYSVIERFEEYINDDLINFKPAEMTEFNIEKINEMYTEAKENLEAYLLGKKVPFYVQKPDMYNLHNCGSVLYDGETPVISVGYGAFDTAISNIPNFDKFGGSNIQMEIGPTRVMKNKSWNFIRSNNPDASYEFVDDCVEGSKAIKFTFNGEKKDNEFLSMYQTVTVTPGSKYILTGKRKADSSMTDTWISLNDFDNKSYHSSQSDWKDFSIKYTVPEEVNQITVRVAVESSTTGYYLDDLSLVKENTNDNLLINSGFEDEDKPVYEFDDNSTYLSTLLDNLRIAKENNVGASVLLSPHYFPDNFSEELYFDSGAFLDFNICHDEAKNLIEDYLRGILPYLAEYKDYINSIFISNEPGFATYCFYDFFLPEFHEFLEEKHGTIQNLNSLYKTDYTDFSEVDMPNGISGYNSIWVAMKERNEAHYDWMQFNEKVLTDWHTWIASIVKEYLPDIPLGTKLLETMLDSSEESYYHGRIIQGADLELFDGFSDLAGNDALTYADDIDSYFTTMFYYDYLNSVTNKPVYNSEDHVIRDKTEEYNDLYSYHVGNYLWQGAIHGRSLSTLWVWDRNTGKNPSFEGSILYRPDVINRIGKTALDLTRLSGKIADFMEKKPEIAIYYSKSSRFYNEDYVENLLTAYKAVLECGKKVGIISDLSIESINDYQVIVIPEALYAPSNTKEKIESYINNGGKVIFSGNALAKDEYRNSLNNSVIINKGYRYTSDNVSGIKTELIKYLYSFDMIDVELIDEEKGTMPSGVDWQYTVGEDGNVLVNISNVEYGTVKNISVYLNGEKLENMIDLISGESEIDTVKAEGFVPQLLCYSTSEKRIDNLRFSSEDNTLRWDFTDGIADEVTVYRVNKNGSLHIEAKLKGNSFLCTERGCYIVKHNRDFSDGKMITVNNKDLFEVQITDVKYLNNAISYRVNIKNISDVYASGAFLAEAKNGDGEIIEKCIFEISLKPGEVKKFTVGISAAEHIENITVSVGENNSCSAVYKNVCEYIF